MFVGGQHPGEAAGGDGQAGQEQQPGRGHQCSQHTHLLTQQQQNYYYFMNVANSKKPKNQSLHSTKNEIHETHGCI